MTRDDVLRMAREAGHPQPGMDALFFQRFAALVASAENDRIRFQIHTCNDQCQHPACVAMRNAVAAERDACAQVCEGLARGINVNGAFGRYRECAAAIRSRNAVGQA